MWFANADAVQDAPLTRNETPAQFGDFIVVQMAPTNELEAATMFANDDTFPEIALAVESIAGRDMR
jgi:hypothetical protein